MSEAFPLMTRAEVAELIQVSESTLSRWHTYGTGPEEIEAALVVLSPGVYRYRRNQIHEFVNGKAA